MKYHLLISSLIFLSLISTSIRAMHWDDPEYEEKHLATHAVHGLTRLQKAVVQHDRFEVMRILEPDKFDTPSSRTERIKKAAQSLVSREQKYTDEQLCDQMTTPHYMEQAGANTLFHTAAGVLCFQILERRMTRSMMDPYTNAYNYKEVDLYYPTSKAEIIRTMIGFLMRKGRLAEVINKPGKDGFTPLHWAVLSALAYTKNGYNVWMLEDWNMVAYGELHQYGADPFLGVDGKNNEYTPVWFTQGHNFQTYFAKKRRLSFDVMNLYRHLYLHGNADTDIPQGDLDFEVHPEACTRVYESLRMHEKNCDYRKERPSDSFGRRFDIDMDGSSSSSGFESFKASRTPPVSQPDLDPYDVLGISRSASLDEINQAYKKLALKHHPDKEQDASKKAAQEARFKEVVAARDALAARLAPSPEPSHYPVPL